ncbi:hypothetical protein [Rhizobium leguminosarum]|uniref:hypothetical protein n=1 Tax=Rhizobium leguminosarum TaxID=384 RepID=UPI001AEC8DD0|nr:hypothetical protein [Rhizobium leguminosarum]
MREIDHPDCHARSSSDLHEHHHRRVIFGVDRKSELVRECLLLGLTRSCSLNQLQTLSKSTGNGDRSKFTWTTSRANTTSPSKKACIPKKYSGISM